jgi:hypothetical protein
MRIKRIIVRFNRFPVGVLIVSGRSIVIKMTGNSKFLTPDPSMAKVTLAIDDLETKAALAKDGGKKEKADLKKAKKKLVGLLRCLAWYVEGVANGDENILVSSGFTLSKEPCPWQRDAFFVKMGINSGSVMIGCIAVPGAVGYLWFRSADKELPSSAKDWILADASTRRKQLLNDLVSGQTYWFIYRALTTNGLMEWSDPIQFHVQ